MEYWDSGITWKRIAVVGWRFERYEDGTIDIDWVSRMEYNMKTVVVIKVVLLKLEE